MPSHPGQPAPAADHTDNPPLAAVPAVNGDSPGPHAGNPPPAARRPTNDEFPDTARSTPGHDRARALGAALPRRDKFHNHRPLHRLTTVLVYATVSPAA